MAISKLGVLISTFCFYKFFGFLKEPPPLYTGPPFLSYFQWDLSGLDRTTIDQYIIGAHGLLIVYFAFAVNHYDLLPPKYPTSLKFGVFWCLGILVVNALVVNVVYVRIHGHHLTPFTWENFVNYVTMVCGVYSGWLVYAIHYFYYVIMRKRGYYLESKEDQQQDQNLPQQHNRRDQNRNNRR